MHLQRTRFNERGLCVEHLFFTNKNYCKQLEKSYWLRHCNGKTIRQLFTVYKCVFECCLHTQFRCRPERRRQPHRNRHHDIVKLPLEKATDANCIDVVLRDVKRYLSLPKGCAAERVGAESFGIEKGGGGGWRQRRDSNTQATIWRQSQFLDKRNRGYQSPLTLPTRIVAPSRFDVEKADGGVSNRRRKNVNFLGNIVILLVYTVF